MATYTVKAASKKKDVDGQYGPMQVIALILDGGNGELHTAEWFTKRETPLPAQESTIEGDLQAGNYGLNFKKARLEGGGGGGMGSPERQRAITRQHSQEMALRAIQLVAPVPIEIDDLRAAITHWADWFDDDVNKAAGVPAGGGSSTSPSNSGQPPPVAGQNPGGYVGFNVKPDGSSPQRDFFEKLLTETPASTETIGRIMLYAETLPNVSSLIDLLKEGATATPTARQLAAEAQEWAAGQPAVPVPDAADLPEPEGNGAVADDDDIPFARPEYRAFFDERERGSNRASNRSPSYL